MVSISSNFFCEQSNKIEKKESTIILLLMQFPPQCLCSYVFSMIHIVTPSDALPPHYLGRPFFSPLTELKVLQDNTELQNILSQFQMPTMQYGSMRIAGFGATE